MWQHLARVKQLATVATLPLSVVTFGNGIAQTYKWMNPNDYARWYLRNISAGQMVEPQYRAPWVKNTKLESMIHTALCNRAKEEVVLVSGRQASGKTSATLMVCKNENRTGFFVDLGLYTKETDDKEKMEAFVVESIVANRFTSHNPIKRAMRLFFPKPQPEFVWEGLYAAFKQGRMVMVVDEVHQLANARMMHDGIFNHFCKISPYGPVVLVGSEYSIPQYMQKMTHVAKRTKVLYPPTATVEEMMPYVQARFKEYAKQVVEELDGSFELLWRLEPEKMPEDLEALRGWHKDRLIYALELTENGMKTPEKAASTGQAMIAAAELAFSEVPVEPLDKGTLELAQAGGAKVETLGKAEKASFATPMTAGVMKELACDEAVHAIMQKRVPPKLLEKFEKAIKGKCTNAIKKSI